MTETIVIYWYWYAKLCMILVAMFKVGPTP